MVKRVNRSTLERAQSNPNTPFLEEVSPEMQLAMLQVPQ